MRVPVRGGAKRRIWCGWWRLIEVHIVHLHVPNAKSDHHGSLRVLDLVYKLPCLCLVFWVTDDVTVQAEEAIIRWHTRHQSWPSFYDSVRRRAHTGNAYNLRSFFSMKAVVAFTVWVCLLVHNTQHLPSTHYFWIVQLLGEHSVQIRSDPYVIHAGDLQTCTLELPTFFCSVFCHFSRCHNSSLRK